MCGRLGGILLVAIAISCSALRAATPTPPAAVKGWPAQVRAIRHASADAPNIPLMRKTSGPARVTVFDGGHEIVVAAALNWLAGQKKHESLP